MEKRKKILFMVAHRPGRSPSQRFRFEQYLPMLEAGGYDCTFSFLIDEADDELFYGPGNYRAKLRILLKSLWRRFQDLKKLKRFDIVFVQREAFMTGTAFFEKQVSKRAKLVFDFDDSIWLNDTSEGNRNLSWLKRPAKTAEIIRVADVTIAGNQYLADYAMNYSDCVVVVPTTIDTHYHVGRTAHEQKDVVCIGWTGTSTTLRHLFSQMLALKKIKEKFGNRIVFRVIVDSELFIEELNCNTVKWNKSDEINQLTKIDIGIMPLPNDEWAKGKCGFKGLQYMALGIPTIMSPVGVNTEIITNGENGFLADTPSEWIAAVSELIENTDRRIRMGQAGRQTVIEQYSVISQQSRYLELFDSLCD